VEESTVPEAAVLEQLGRLLASPELSTSPQLSTLLRHVVERTLRGEPEALKESTLALDVFNRPSDHNPKIDPIVRVEARRLRTKLDAYYKGRGQHDPVRISLPKGGYVPMFSGTPIPPEPAETLPAAVPEPPQRSGKRVTWFALIAAIVAIAAAVQVWRSAAADPVEIFWAEMLGATRPSILVPADSGLVLLQTFVKGPVSLQEYMTGQYLERPSASGASAASYGRRRYTSIVDLQFAVRLAVRSANRAADLRVRYARDLRLDDIKGANLIFLGGKASNPWLELYQDDTTMTMSYDEVQKVASIVNLAPQSGEQALYKTDGTGEVYGLIAYHENSNHSGHILAIGGTTVAGTEAAADFVLNDARMRPYLKRARTPEGIAGFDILVQSRNLGGGATLADVVAFHGSRDAK
jgi:hypothetical protein